MGHRLLRIGLLDDRAKRWQERRCRQLGSHDEVLREIADERAIFDLTIRNVDLRLALLLEPANPDLGDDTHDRSLTERNVEALADRAFVRPVLLGERLAHDRDEQTLLGVRVLDVASAPERDVHRAEVPGRHEAQAHRVGPCPRWLGPVYPRPPDAAT